jgi:UDP-2-acetamido-2,6-beta-L-arabino-hexul-4-ose reductase
MVILVTGSQGFIGRNLIAHLQQYKNYRILEYDVDSAAELLETYTASCDIVIHLAGINRPRDASEFMSGNTEFTKMLLLSLQQHGNKAPIVVTSSVHAQQLSRYGESKKAMEDLVFDHAKKNGSDVLVYRLPNVFGKWCRPNYNSAVATFCYNISRELPITVTKRDTILPLVYIDDVITTMITAMHGNPTRDGVFCVVNPVYTVTLGQIVDLLSSFHQSRNDLYLPDLSDPFIKKLYSTYLSYLPTDQFGYALDTHTDGRGSFTEFLRTTGNGQVSVNITKPGVTKGNHWHHTKAEKFLAVSGSGIIRFCSLFEKQMIEYPLDGKIPYVIDVPPGYSHRIENTGDQDLILLIWVNECYDARHPDTYALEVADG